MTPAALAAATVGWGFDAGSLQRLKDRLVPAHRNLLVRAIHMDVHLEVFSLSACRIVPVFLGIGIVARKLLVELPAAQAQFFHLLIGKDVQGLGAADEQGILLRGVFLY